jgi:ADP-heptose:LPS heptosyltransferase
MYSRTKWPAVLLGSGLESELGVSLRRLAPHTRIHDLIGKTSILEYAAIIQQGKLVISNETSATHIAAATGTPALTILGGGHYGRFVPYELSVGCDTATSKSICVANAMSCFNCDWQCPFSTGSGPRPCIEQICAASVKQALDELLSRSLHRGLCED